MYCSVDTEYNDTATADIYYPTDQGKGQGIFPIDILNSHSIHKLLFLCIDSTCIVYIYNMHKRIKNPKQSNAVQTIGFPIHNSQLEKIIVIFPFFFPFERLG